MKRKGISKSVRFAIFSRDGYSCRYCGAQADTVSLVIDHVIPVAQGGTNDPENLVTACQPCNAGKAARTPTQAAPTESDRLRIAQERNEQLRAAEHVQRALEARKEFRQSIVNAWCDIRGTKEVNRRTIATVTAYVEEFGIERVLSWIDMANSRLVGDPDYKLGMYISGIRRRFLAEQEERAANADLLIQETAPPEPAEPEPDAVTAQVIADAAEYNRLCDEADKAHVEKQRQELQLAHELEQQQIARMEAEELRRAEQFALIAQKRRERAIERGDDPYVDMD